MGRETEEVEAFEEVDGGEEGKGEVVAEGGGGDAEEEGVGKMIIGVDVADHAALGYGTIGELAGLGAAVVLGSGYEAVEETEAGVTAREADLDKWTVDEAEGIVLGYLAEEVGVLADA